jgi:hypothetical protein
MSTDSPEEMSEWINYLKLVQGKSKEEIQTLLDSARVNPRNAEVCCISPVMNALSFSAGYN